MDENSSLLATKINKLERKYDEQFQVVFEAIQQLIKEEQKPRKLIGFKKIRYLYFVKFQTSFKSVRSHVVTSFKSKISCVYFLILGPCFKNMGLVDTCVSLNLYNKFLIQKISQPTPGIQIRSYPF